LKITYVAHSCFAVELDSAILVFDYYKGELPAFSSGVPVYVFSSHSHADHFNLEIFSLLEDCQDVRYIFSRDIRRKYGKSFFLNHGVSEADYEKITFIPSGKTESIGDVTVETLKSTDAGVAFIVTAYGRTIFHAGDLNWWTWAEQSPKENQDMEKRFKKQIDSLDGRHFDVAFMVLDSRQDEDFYRGFDYFMRHTDTDVVFPMHYWDDDRVIDRLCRMECSLPYRDRIVHP